MLDKTDERILDILQAHSDFSVREIAKALRIPITTIYNRIKKLKEKKIIKRYTVELDYNRLGRLLSAYVLVRVDQKSLSERKMTRLDLTDLLKKNRDILTVANIAGQFDIVLKISVKSIDELNDFLYKYLKNIPGIERTETMIILNE